MNAKGADVQKMWLPGDHYDIIDVASDDSLVQLNTVLDGSDGSPANGTSQHAPPCAGFNPGL